MYNPGDTLDPACSLTDPNCTVTSPAYFSFSSSNFSGTGNFITTGTVQGGTLTDGILSISLGSITAGVNATFSGTITAPTILGGTATTSDLTLQTTSGVGDTGADMHFLVGNNGATEAMTILNNGNVGIGTTAPNNLLQVASLIDFNQTDSNTKIGYQAGLNIVSGAGFNTFLGHQAGLSSATLSTNAADHNVAVGYRALYSNTTGKQNAVIGSSALYSNTTGYYNSAMGYGALNRNTTGNNNSAMGYYALYYLVGDYSDNTALGYKAGFYQADGATSLTTPNQSVYIGSGAMGFNNSDVNSIVIGYLAKGIGANSVVLGNDSITTTALKGNVGIGTATPAYKLSVGSAGYTSTFNVDSSGYALHPLGAVGTPS
ncbi:MAG: hypothetical protein Q8O66_02815, partial [bacterium]|nr:hypothetical protein [bacterium]